ncbi:LysM peptidoglycan-binding domain-containing protein [Paenibacillus psychroresistens]|uniref:LysM peptidoglycan-binding domain-containing protein n=1 Tax=Paenibacillus psychroresistens TaxID=1778678 RepID=A0A6B8RLH9_9BACL|nr:peptidoglycan DD-metalloendopeptidase family protein [Paenibacillus psychroresistens]QGQ96614.1 LysM peptidoglycan-binding domain-containing protein [Paenibacillus psychroresistens]
MRKTKIKRLIGVFWIFIIILCIIGVRSSMNQRYIQADPNEVYLGKKEAIFKDIADDAALLLLLENNIPIKKLGIELKIDGKTIGIVKDTETVNEVMEQIKAPYLVNSQEASKVNILSDTNRKMNIKMDKNILESVEFEQKVDMATVEINPKLVLEPSELLRKLQTGDVQMRLYTVQSGDCISCIAKKFSVPKAVIYQNNPWIENDFINVGDELNLTVLQPQLTVRTIENRMESMEMMNETIYEEDKNMREGTSKVIVEGKTGMKQITYRITKINGQTIEEKTLVQVILKEPVTKVIKQGTKVIPGIGSGSFAWPVVGPQLTSEFGKRWGKLHAGTDTVSDNKNILAADNGKVIFAGKKSGYGNCIIIDHQNGYQTLYGHLSKINVVDGQKVLKGEKIGLMGSTGNSTGVHLHFEIRKDDKQENPLKYLDY